MAKQIIIKIFFCKKEKEAKIIELKSFLLHQALHTPNTISLRFSLKIKTGGENFCGKISSFT